MAGQDLIDSYLAKVRAVVAFRPDADAIVEELEDHLRCGVERRVNDGLDEDDAQRESLEVLGEAGVVARELCRSDDGGLALPSQWSRRGGVAALTAAALALASLVPLCAAVRIQVDGSDGVTAYWIYAVVLASCSAMSLVALSGMLARTGAGHGARSLVALGIAGLGVLLTALFAWGSVVTLGLVWGPYVFALVRLGRIMAVPVMLWAHVAAWPAAVATFALLDWRTGLGPVDSYGHYPWAWFVAAAVFAILWGVGQFGLGRVLVTEHPVELPSSTLVA